MIYKKKDYLIAMQRLAHLRDVSHKSGNGIPYDRYKREYEIIKEYSLFCFKDKVEMDLTDEDELDIVFNNMLFKSISITPIKLIRYIRSGYQGAVFSEQSKEEFMERFKCTKDKIRSDYGDFEERFYNSDSYNLFKRY